MRNVITVLVYDTYSLRPVTFCADGKGMTPTDEAREAWKHICSTPFPVIRVYNGTVPNMLGEAIELGLLERNQVQIYHPNGVAYYFDDRGVIENWEFGTFNNHFDLRADSGVASEAK